MTKKQMKQLVQAARGAANAHNEGDKTSIHNLQGMQMSMAALGAYLELYIFKGVIHQITLTYGDRIESVLIQNETEDVNE